MNVSLSAQLQDWVQEKVDTGLYQSASEVVREALRLLREHEELRQLRLNELRRDIAAGMADIRAGRTRNFDAAQVSAIKQQGRSRLRQATR